MKSLLKLLFIFLLTFLTQVGLNSSGDVSLSQNPINYIQNDYQKIVLTSEVQRPDVVISSNTSNDNTNFLNRDSAGSSEFFNKLNLSRNNPCVTAGNIHIISSKLETEISIRAP